MCADDDGEADDGENQQQGHHLAGGEEQKGSKDAIEELRYEKAVEELFEDVVGNQKEQTAALLTWNYVSAPWSAALLPYNADFR